MEKQHCLNCASWTPESEGVGTCQHYGLRFQFEGPRFEVGRQYDCFQYQFEHNRRAWTGTRLEVLEAERLRLEHDAVYEQMRYERIKEHPLAYWQKVKAERKARLDMMVG